MDMIARITALLLSVLLCMGMACAELADDGYMPYASEAVYDMGSDIDDFSVVLCDGTEVTLEGLLKDHEAVLLNIWASWCTPCIEEMPMLQEAYERYGDRMAVLCLSPEDVNETISGVKQVLKLTTLPMGSDTAGLADKLGVAVYPTSVVIDRFGKLVFYAEGAFSDADEIGRMAEVFLGDGYTESVELYAIPGVECTVENPTGEALDAALCPDGTVWFGCSEDPTIWPFLPQSGAAVNSNTIRNSIAELWADTVAQAGDVLVFDYDITAMNAINYALLTVDGEPIFYFTGTMSGTYAYRFEEAGPHEIYWSYGVAEECETDRVAISDVRVLTGEEGDAAIAAMPVYPRTLSGSALKLQILNEDARRVVVNDPSGMFELWYGDVLTYLLPSDTVRVRGEIGSDVDVSCTYLVGSADYEQHMLVQCETDTEGYIAEIPLSDTSKGGESSTCVYLQEDGNEENTQTVMVWTSEADLDSFVKNELFDEMFEPVEGGSWSYAENDGAGSNETSEGADGRAYTIRAADETGAPIPGVKLYVCGDTTCRTGVTDENGAYTFIGEVYPYSVHVLSVPDGYVRDEQLEEVMNEQTELTITVARGQE